MATQKINYLTWFTALLLIMACVPTFATSAPAPIIDPNSIGTIIAQTAVAAATQTDAALPTLTPTTTFTPTPRNTDTLEPSATATVHFLFFTPSPAINPAQPNGSGKSSKPYDCEILDSAPANGTVFASRTDFEATWKIKNIGTREWEAHTINYVYVSGDKIHKVASYDLGPAIVRGDVKDLIVSMLAPKNPGTYTTYWALHTGSEYFCGTSLTITVN